MGDGVARRQDEVLTMSVIPLHQAHELHPQAIACGNCEIRKLAIFRALDHHALDGIHTSIATQSFAADDVIHQAGELAHSVITIRTGIVRFERATECGDRRIVRLAGRGDLIGQESLVGRAFSDDITACTPVTICRIPRGLIDELSHQDDSLIHELMARWQSALDDSQTWVTDLATGPAIRRMLHLVERLERYRNEHGEIWLPRREDMGAMLDMTFETASRLVSQLKREGVLSVVGPRHARVDHEKLLQAINHRASI
jgi:CRP-like cAMP-binding protein